jgi:drug/metabolite transporter (DMT)-like permease
VLAIVFWRNALALPVLLPAVALRRRDEVRGLDRRRALFCVLAGVALAGHFMTWVPSTKLTSIATATALATTQPVWTGLIGARGLPRRTWLGIGVAVVGAIAATGADIGASSRALVGDLLALAAGLLGAVYTLLGERARATLSTTTYTSICYAVCAAVALVVCLAFRVPLVGFPAGAWIVLVALTLGPQLLGHSMFSYALRRVPATTVSVLTLLEVPGAALVAWAWLGQTPRLASVPGLVLLLVGVAVVASGRTASVPTQTSLAEL